WVSGYWNMNRMLVAPPVGLPEAGDELVLEDLHRRIARQRVDDLELLGDLLRHQLRGAAVGLHLLEGERRGPGPHLDHGADALAPRRVRQSDDRDRADARMRHE